MKKAAQEWKYWNRAMRQIRHAEDNLEKSGDIQGAKLLHRISHLLFMEGTGADNTAHITNLAHEYQKDSK